MKSGDGFASDAYRAWDTLMTSIQHLGGVQCHWESQSGVQAILNIISNQFGHRVILQRNAYFRTQYAQWEFQFVPCEKLKGASEEIIQAIAL